MRNKHLIYLGLAGVVTPLSMLLWLWRVIDVESLSMLVPQPIKFYTLIGGVLISLVFAGMTVYFLVKSRNRCVACGLEMERQIIQAEKLATVGQLAGGVAHEVNTPASIISGRVETMLLSGGGYNERDLHDLAVIKQQSERISQITKGLLLFAKRAPTEKTKVEINDIVKEGTALIETQLKKMKIKVVLDLCPRPVYVLGQHNQLVQVLLNLLSNARDAMPQGGTLEIKTENLNGFRQAAVLHVSDTGTGISPENRSKIFDPFFTTKKAGTGLGLSVSYGIVQDHGGNIQVKSEKGEGTTFSVFIPTMDHLVRIKAAV